MIAQIIIVRRLKFAHFELFYKEKTTLAAYIEFKFDFDELRIFYTAHYTYSIDNERNMQMGNL